MREYLKFFDADPYRDWVFDPFCGTGTTPVEARLKGFSTLSTDANPFSILATRVKLSWDIEDVAVKAGYEVEGIHLWRTRRSTTTGQDLEENILLLSVLCSKFVYSLIVNESGNRYVPP